MKELAATVTSKGQITIPVEVRRHLGLHCGDKLAFVVTDEGEVVLRAPKYRGVAALAGAAGKLARPLSTAEMREIAREDALAPEDRPAQDRR